MLEYRYVILANIAIQVTRPLAQLILTTTRIPLHSSSAKINANVLAWWSLIVKLLVTLLVALAVVQTAIRCGSTVTLRKLKDAQQIQELAQIARYVKTTQEAALPHRFLTKMAFAHSATLTIEQALTS